MRSDHGAGYCPACGKVRYYTRKAARAARRTIPGSHARRVYACGEFFHLTSATAAQARQWRRPFYARTP